MWKFLITFLAVTLQYYYTSALEVGDTCEDRHGFKGECKLILDCPSVIESISQGTFNFKNRCGFKDNVLPIVCCFDSPQQSASVDSTSDANKILRKSEVKCQEYAKSVYQNRTVLAPNPTIVRIDTCAVKVSQLIVGGEPSKNKEFPHMALLGYERKDRTIAYSCGGSLISERYVLTAGHCLFSRQYGPVKYVRLGEYDLSKTSESEIQELNVIERIKHPDYKPPSQYNDIALLKLDQDVILDEFVRPICLQTSKEFNVRKSIASGWGRQEYFDENGSDILLKVTLDLFSNEECGVSFPKNSRTLKNGIADESQVCAGSKTERKDTCQGDSGGPLQIYHPSEYCMYSIVGVTSFGKGCGSNIPGVYTRVSNYLDWIEEIVWPDN